MYICFLFLSLSLFIFIFVLFIIFIIFSHSLSGIKLVFFTDSGQSATKKGVLCAKRIREKNDTKCVSTVPKNIKVMVQEALSPALDILQSEDLARWEK